MDIVYGDLENYQDENVLSELRNENQELKCKLEEYASTLAHLQKDFDKLSIEYKNLELNYSSLLKTARAEIERKSQLITNLNLEKDKLVIESIQSRGRAPKRKVNGNGNIQQTGKQSGRGDSAKEEHSAADPNSTAKSVFAPLLSQINNERKDKHDNKQTQDPTVKGDLETKEKEQKSTTSDHNRDRDKNKSDNKKRKESNSNILSNPTDRVSKIRNRRKSMPLLNRGDIKLSSDDDNDNDNRIRRKTPLRDEIDRKYHEKYNGRNYTERKIPESTRVGDRNKSNYDSSRDIYRKSNSWYRDSDRNKSRDNRDTHDLNQRSRRHYSPDRPHYNIQEDYYNKHRESNDRPHRSDNVRHRVLESPERYNKHRRSRDSDRQRFDRFQHEQVYPMKHKIHDITEEPACKRQRSELLNKQSDKYNMNLQAKDVASRARSLSRSLEFSYLSLQSPDYLENNAPVHHIKEIMGTADTKLDDPRLTSKKYVIRTHNDKGVLSTVIGRHVDIKVIDTTTWGMDKDKEIHKMPTPLREKPQINEDLAKHIYMGIDDPISNLSLESGELFLDDEEMCTVSENKDVVSVTREGAVNTKGSINKSMCHNDQSHDRIHVEKKEATSPKLFSKTYKIPKTKKLNEPKPLEDDKSHSTRNKLTKKDITKESNKKRTNKEKRERDKKSQPEIPDYNPLKMFSDAIGVCKNKSNKFVDVNKKIHITEKVMTSARDTVAGDLELSDETCDYTEVADDFGYDKKSIIQSEEGSKNNVFGGTNKGLNIELKNLENKEINVLKYGIEPVCENRCFDIPLIGNAVQCKESLIKVHNEDKSKNIKSKICNLFGESNSLITPEELGILETPKENLNEYVPLFDNTQDAIDLNVEDMEKVQTRSMTLKCDESFLNHAQQDVPLDKVEENVVKNPTDEEKQKFKNSIESSSSSIQQMFENINAEPDPEDNKTVKTVIISTGMQNKFHSASAVDEEQEKLTNIRSKVNECAPICPPLLNFIALATSTPHKETQLEPSLPVPETSNSNNSKVVTTDASNITSSDAQGNLDVPDLRIIVRRRRKPRGKTS